jgi:hypothetical protein
MSITRLDPHATAVDLFIELATLRRRLRSDTGRIEAISRAISEIDAQLAPTRTSPLSVTSVNQPSQSNPCIPRP